jgi:lipoate-protein ligase B
MASICRVYRLGVMPYTQAWELQDRLAGRIAAGEHPPALLLLEHPHVFTFGRRGQAQHLLWDEAALAAHDVDVQWVDRGGDVTYHGPGQLVGYPLLPLAPGGLAADEASAGRLPPADFVGYLRRLEEVIILALARLGAAAYANPGRTGVWVQPGSAGGGDSDHGGGASGGDRNGMASAAHRPPLAKIASIGVKVDARGVTRHGFAINVNPDMRYWEGIVACGLQDASAACLADLLDAPPAVPQVMEAVTDAFAEIFGYEMEPGFVT